MQKISFNFNIKVLNLLVPIIFFKYIVGMEFKEFTAGVDDNDRRLDKVLRNFLDKSRLSEIYKLIRKGLIKVNKKKTTPDYHVMEGDIISIAAFLFQNNEETDKKSGNITIPPVVFENKHILIINKPYDVNVHGDAASLDIIIPAYYNSKYENNSLSFTPGPLHRLDKKTTGLLAFSFSLEGARWFTEKIRNHEITKKYFGLIQGSLENQEEWIDFISKKETSKGFATVTAQSTEEDDGKEAITIVTPLAYGKYEKLPVTFVSFDIKTGRKHQIRSQSGLHKHPLLGDTAYGGKKIINTDREFYLQAYELNLPENSLDLPRQIKIEPASDLIKVLNYCGIKQISL